MHRATLALAFLFAACSADPAVEPAPVATEVAPVAEADAPELQPAQQVEGTWVSPMGAVVIGPEGIGAVADGDVAFQPYTITSSGADAVVLTAEDGTVYTVALGAEPALRIEGQPDTTFSRR